MLTAIDRSEWRRAAPSRAIWLSLCALISATLAYILPDIVGFDHLMLHTPAQRATAMLAMWGAGLWLQRRNGFSLHIVGLRRPALSLVLICAGVAVWCAMLDAMVFPSLLPTWYAHVERQPLALRLVYYCARAFNENVAYRLFLGSLCAFGLRAIVPTRFATVAAVVGMAAAQVFNVWLNVVLPTAFDPATAGWLLLRFVVPGVAWGWLYIRHGFAANEGAAMGVHVFLQPLMSVVFR